MSPSPETRILPRSPWRAELSDYRGLASSAGENGEPDALGERHNVFRGATCPLPLGCDNARLSVRPNGADRQWKEDPLM
jgi:hypothetical protein